MYAIIREKDKMSVQTCTDYKNAQMKAGESNGKLISCTTDKSRADALAAKLDNVHFKGARNGIA